MEQWAMSASTNCEDEFEVEEVSASDIREIADDITKQLDQLGNKTMSRLMSATISIDECARFKAVTDDDTNTFLQNTANKNTVYKTKSDWASTVGKFREIEDLSRTELGSLIARFYLSVRRKDGTEYEPDSVSSIQNSIDRHLRDTKSSINIKKDVEFSHRRRVLESKRKELKSLGKGNKKNKADSLSADEMKILYEKRVLGAANSQSVLQTLWMNNGVPRKTRACLPEMGGH